MTTREKLSTLIETLPEESLEAAVEQLMALVRSDGGRTQRREAEPEVVEFHILAQPSGRTDHYRLHPPHRPGRKSAMLISEPSEAERLRHERFLADMRWWNEHIDEITAQCREPYVAIFGGELFPGGSYFDALEKAILFR